MCFINSINVSELSEASLSRWIMNQTLNMLHEVTQLCSHRRADSWDLTLRVAVVCLQVALQQRPDYCSSHPELHLLLGVTSESNLNSVPNTLWHFITCHHLWCPPRNTQKKGHSELPLDGSCFKFSSVSKWSSEAVCTSMRTLQTGAAGSSFSSNWWSLSEH